MCGHYYTDIEITVEELEAILAGVPDKPKEQIIQTELDLTLARDVNRTDLAPLVSREGVKMMRFGFPPVVEKGSVVVNARSETLLDKWMYDEARKSHRCLVPASYYYEPSSVGPYKFWLRDSKIIYMAGIYNGDAFAVITREAPADIKKIHHRMPVILQGSAMYSWLSKDIDIMNTLSHGIVELEYQPANGLEQQSFFQ